MFYKINIFIAVIIFMAFTATGWAMNINDLLDAAAHQPGHEISTLSVRQSNLQKDKATSSLFPKLGLFSSFEKYNSPTNLRPMAPTEVNVKSGASIPFSEEIFRYGLSFDAPLYVRKLYVLRQKSALLLKKAKTEQQLDLLDRQASVVSLNSGLAYIQALESAIDARRASLGKTIEDMSVKVKSGRSPQSELLKLQKTLNDLDQQRNRLDIKRLDTLREIQELTGIKLTSAVDMTLIHQPSGTSYLSVTAARYNADAAKKEVERSRAQRWPTLSVTGFVSGNEGDAYNTGSRISQNYNKIALVLKFPLFDRTLNKDESIARVQLEKAKRKLEQTRLNMNALSESLKNKIPVVEKSITLSRQSVKDSRALLAVAKVAVRSGRMTTEDYLRYESDVLASQAALYQARDQRWQIIAKQAVLYGMDMKGVVK